MCFSQGIKGSLCISLSAPLGTKSLNTSDKNYKVKFSGLGIPI